VKNYRLAADERGFALLAVTLVLALLGVVVTELAFSMRLEAAMVRTYKDAVLARHLAEAGVQQAIREILSDATVHGLDDDGQVVFYNVAQTGATPKAYPKLPRSHVRLGSGEFSYRITDEEGRLNVNTRAPGTLERLLTVLEIDKDVRDIISDSIEDWRDTNETHRINGAESDYYLQQPVPYRSRNANLQDVAELLQIQGITPAIYYGHDDKPGLVDLLTVRSRGINININTAPKAILQGQGLSDAEVSDVMQSRATRPYGVVPPRYTTRQFITGSTTFRIESQGLIGGEPRARLMVIVQRTVGLSGAVPVLAVFTWRTLPSRPAAPAATTKSGAS